MGRPQRLFFYGTLTHDCDNPVTRAVLPLLRCLCRVEARRTLHAIPDPDGWYPGVTDGRPKGNQRVPGWLYETGPQFDHGALRTLDRWEFFDPARPAASEFVRRAVRARLGHWSVAAQAYG
ncbi:MAG: gamma-glutamylcyclotransferase [Novosphingobium sp.]